MKLIDLAGKKFGRLTVVNRVERNFAYRNRNLRWKCICECGKTAIIRGQHLKTGLIRSCGCLRAQMSAETARQLSFKHGHCVDGGETRTYHSWQAMHARCYKPKTAHFDRYGGRGIQVCCRWHRSNPNAFQNFLADMGERPLGKTLDRINNAWSYMPSNCRWATPSEQNRDQVGVPLSER